MNNKYIPVYRVELVREKSVKAENAVVSSPADAADIAGDYLENADREHFIIMMLSTRNHVIGINTVSIGSLNASIVHPREVFKPAILANSNSIILVHNHPSGDPSLSREDVEITKRLEEAGSVLGIEIIDHLVIGSYPDGGTRYYSLKEQGII